MIGTLLSTVEGLPRSLVEKCRQFGYDTAETLYGMCEASPTAIKEWLDYDESRFVEMKALLYAAIPDTIKKKWERIPHGDYPLGARTPGER